MKTFIQMIEAVESVTYVSIMFMTNTGAFPSASMPYSALFKYPSKEKWTTIRRAIEDVSLQFGFKRKEARDSQQIELSNWTASKKWTKFDYQNGKFVMVDKGDERPKKKVKPVSDKEIQQIIQQRQQEKIDWIKRVYAKVGYDLSKMSDEQILAMYEKSKI